MQQNKLIVILIGILLTACHTHQGFHTNKNMFSILEKKDQKKITDEKTLIKIQELQNNNVIYFELNKYNILCNFFQILDVHANFLQHYPFCNIIIEGHADERGTPEYNIALGERRANSVKMYLQSRGVLSNQITVVSYGKEKPAVLGHNEEAYAKNRRVVLVY